MLTEIDKLEDIVKRIDLLPELESYIYVDANEYRWLQARRIVANGLDATPDVRSLMKELTDAVQRLLVDEVGQHDGFMWELQMHGYRILRAGADLKGSIFSGLHTPYQKWLVSFG
jgi:hypothetical protein